VIHFVHTQCIYRTSCHFIQAATATEAKYPVRVAQLKRWLNSTDCIIRHCDWQRHW